jgi:hypothetical protein
MWVKVREREKNKEKCVNGATFLTATYPLYKENGLGQVGDESPTNNRT